MPKIFLVGFMASGKTTIGKLLATHMKMAFIDTDDLIVENVGMSISEYITKNGESAFRKKETEILKCLSKVENAIISTGGGMPCFNNNIQLINKLGVSYYLCTGLDTIYNRISKDKNRPLAFNKSKTDLSKLYKSRLEYYNLANHKILSNRDPNKVASRIVDLISK
jgi:shikimate kinase